MLRTLYSITLLLFVLMQAMVVSPDRIPGQGAARNPVAFVSPFAPARGMSDEESAAQSLPDPAASSPPGRISRTASPEGGPVITIEPSASGCCRKAAVSASLPTGRRRRGGSAAPDPSRHL